MEYIKLKNSDLTVSRLCMGGCPMGGYGWGKTQEEELIGAVHAALDNGVTFFDTADTYGLGQSEITLGKGLKGHRHEVVIQSKFGVRVGNGKTVYDNSPEYIRFALEQSLNRLGTDYVDLYVIHYRDPSTPMEAVVETLETLRDEGKIRYFGLSNIHAEGMDELLPYKGSFVNCQDEYSLACRKNEADLLAIHEKMDVNPMTWGSLGQGILTGKYTRENIQFGSDDRRSREIYVNFHGEKLEQNLRIVDAMRDIAPHYGKPLSALAIRFILDHLPESVVLCGAKRPSQVLGNIEGLDWHLSEEDIQRLDEVSR